MRTHLRMAMIGASVVLLTAACSGTTTPDPAAAQTTRPPASTTEAPVSTAVASTTGSNALATPAQVAAATGFIRARSARNVDAALAYLDPSVNLEWGPGKTYDTLEAGMAWEDAFGIVSSPQACRPIETSGAPVVQCQLLVQTAVAEAFSREPGIDCVDFSFEDGSIIHAVLGAEGEGCGYDYWNPTFVPFYAWMAAAHPESDPDAMYADRISPDGLALWAQYTQEFLADQAG
jgi:hypothetical protein